MHRSSGRTNDYALRGLALRRREDTHSDVPSGIYISPDGQVVDAGAPAADSPAQSVGVGVSTTQLVSPTGHASASVPTDATATLVPSSTFAITTGSATPASAITLLTSAVSLDPTTLSTTAASTTTLASISAAPLAVVPSSSSSIASTTTTTSDGSSETSQRDSAYEEPSLRTQSFWLLIALAVVAFFLVVFAIIGWWLRMRQLRREAREEEEEEEDWPWDQYQGQDGFDARQHRLESGLGIHTDGGGRGVKWWDSEHMIEKAGAGEMIAPPPPAHTHQRAHGSSPFVAGSRESGQSVADYAQDMGTLHIRNLAPGDISGGETSRASTALGRAHHDAHAYPEEYGTPYAPQRPVFMSLEGQGLETPWAPLRTKKSRVEEGLKQRQYARDADAGAVLHEVSLEEPLPYPGENPAEGDEKRDSWAASIRSNLYNVYSTVVGNESTPQVVADDDSFTRQPARHSTHRRRAAPRGPRDNSFDVSRSDAGDPSTSEHSWTLEETGRGRGIVHIRDSLETYDVPRNDDRNPFGHDTDAPYAMNGSQFLSAGEPSTRTSSIYSTVSGQHPPAPARVGRHPPRLPSIPNLSATTSEEYGGGPRRRESRSAANHRRRTKKYGRPALPTRKSSQESATSVGSDMSRTTSACSDELTDGERFAKQVLRERRRRMREVAVGRTKTSRSRATTMSRRRSNVSFRRV